MGGQWLNFFDISFRVQSLALAVSGAFFSWVRLILSRISCPISLC